MAERQGYGDYQRTVNWDGPLVLREFNTHEGLFTTPRFNAARFAYLSGFFTSSISSFLATIQWFLEEGGGETIGQREFVLDEGITQPGQIHLPHLGPWFQITMKGKPATLYGPQILLFNSNRVYPLEFLPRSPTLIVNEHVFAAAGEIFVFPTSYFTGPMQCMVVLSAGVEVQITVEVETEPGVFVPIDRTITAAPNNNGVRLMAPAGAWRLLIKATGAVTTKVRIAPYLTGSS